jgi:AcrR family transcriptional regulator
MPAPVDHDARRRRIAERAGALIAKGGLEAVTYRRLAADAECSTTVITYYFANRHELLFWAYRDAAERSQRRFDVAMSDSGGDLVASLCALLPVSPESVDDWRVYFAFWHTATIDPILTREHRWWLHNCRRVIAELLQSHYAIEPKRARHLARMLLTLLLGIAAQAMFDQRGFTAERQRRLLTDQVAALGLRLNVGAQSVEQD